MANERKKVIVEEIQYWKDHQLLPKEYCDFLLALYTHGEGFTEDNQPKKTTRPLFSLLYLGFLLFLLPLTFLLLYFTELSTSLQTGLIFLLLIFTFMNIIFYQRKNSINVHVAIIVFLLILFVSSVDLASTIDQSIWMINSTILMNCMLWIIIGYRKKLYYLLASGIIGIILLSFYIFM